MGAPELLEPHEIQDIKDALWNGARQDMLAQKYSISQTTISRMVRGLRHSSVPWPDGSLGAFPHARLKELRRARSGQKESERKKQPDQRSETEPSQQKQHHREKTTPVKKNKKQSFPPALGEEISPEEASLLRNLERNQDDALFDLLTKQEKEEESEEAEEDHQK